MSDPILMLGRYQLENLVSAGLRFLFIDLRTEAERSEITDPLFANAMALSADALFENLTSNQVPPDSPIVLLDQTGDASLRLAAELEAKSYSNVYVIRGGARELTSQV